MKVGEDLHNELLPVPKYLQLPSIASPIAHLPSLMPAVPCTNEVICIDEETSFGRLRMFQGLIDEVYLKSAYSKTL